MSHSDQETQKSFLAPFHAHAYPVEDGWKGVLRLDGKTVLYDEEVYPDPQRAADAVVLKQVKILREINSFYGAFGNSAGELVQVTPFTHERKPDAE